MNSIKLKEISLVEISIPTIELPMIGLPLGGGKITPSGDSFVLDLSVLDGSDVLN